MRWKETLYHRRLKKPIDEATRTQISSEFSRRRHEIPIAASLLWHPVKPQFTIESKWLAFVVDFSREELVVIAELTLAAKMYATRENRETAVRFIESLATEIGL